MTDALPPSLTEPPSGYADWLSDLKTRIHSAQQRAALAVNRELVLLYWQIGRDILARQASQGWGAKAIERLAHDLHATFPQMKVFRRTISSTCRHLPRPSRILNLCSRLLHNCHRRF